MSRRRVVITGLGTINPVAHDVPTYWRALLAGKSGIGPITLIDSTAFKVHFAGEVKDFQPGSGHQFQGRQADGPLRPVRHVRRRWRRSKTAASTSPRKTRTAAASSSAAASAA